MSSSSRRIEGPGVAAQAPAANEQKPEPERPGEVASASPPPKRPAELDALKTRQPGAPPSTGSEGDAASDTHAYARLFSLRRRRYHGVLAGMGAVPEPTALLPALRFGTRDGVTDYLPPSGFGQPSSLPLPEIARHLRSSIVPELQQFGDYSAFELLLADGEKIGGRSISPLQSDYGVVREASKLVALGKLPPADSTGTLFLIKTTPNLAVANFLLGRYRGSQSIHYFPAFASAVPDGKASYFGNFVRAMEHLVSYGEESAALQQRNAVDWPSCHNLIITLGGHSVEGLPDPAWMKRHEIVRVFVLTWGVGETHTAGPVLDEWVNSTGLPAKKYGLV